MLGVDRSWGRLGAWGLITKPIRTAGRCLESPDAGSRRIRGAWGQVTVAPTPGHTFALRSRKALAITETLDRLMAAAAMIGESSKPVNGYSTPAAMGIPSVL